jgi:hypothetical protein
VSEKKAITPPTTQKGVVLEISNMLASCLLNSTIAIPELNVATAFNVVAFLDVSMSFYVDVSSKVHAHLFILLIFYANFS